MTLNITKKKIEKVLELFNHPQTRKIRKNRGKKRRRNNKSFNRKNGRKNLATSTLKKKGGHAGHHPPLLNGGQVGVVLGGQVGGNGGKVLKTIVSKLSDPLKTKLSEILLKADNKKKTLVAFVKQKLKITKKTDKETDNETEFTDLNNIKDNGIEVTIKDNNGIEDIEDIVDIVDISDEDIEGISDEDIVKIQELVNPFLSNVSLNTNITDTSDSSTNTEQPKEGKITESETNPEETPEETKKEEPKSKEIDTSEMLKVALASNYFTQYGILSGMLKMNQEKDKDKFDVMEFVQDPKLYAEFCNKMGFQFAEMKEQKEENEEKDTVVANEDANTQNNNETPKNSDENPEEQQ